MKHLIPSFLALTMLLPQSSGRQGEEPNYFEAPLALCRDKFAAAVEAKFTPEAEKAFQSWLACMRKHVKEI